MRIESHGRPPPKVVEDVDEGPVVAGLRTRPARSAEELRAVFNLGRANRDKQVWGGDETAVGGGRMQRWAAAV
jgi:hypothetical protein